MSAFLLIAAVLVLATVALGLLRVIWGPGEADRMMAAQLFGTGGVAILLLLAAATEEAQLLNVALTLALLAAFVAVAFYKNASGGASDDGSDCG